MSLACPQCRHRADYQIKWVRRTKKDRVPAGADERDRAKFAKSFTTSTGSTTSSIAPGAAAASRSRRTSRWCRCRKANADSRVLHLRPRLRARVAAGRNHQPAWDRNTRLLIRSAVSPALLARTVRVPYTLRRRHRATPASCSRRASSTTTRRRWTRRSRSTTTTAARVDDEAAVLRDRGRSSSSSATSRRSRSKWPRGWACRPSRSPTSPGTGSTRRIRASPSGRLTCSTRFARAYGHATLALELPFGGGFDVFPRVERCRWSRGGRRKTRAATRAHFGLPATGGWRCCRSAATACRRSISPPSTVAATGRS